MVYIGKPTGNHWFPSDYQGIPKSVSRSSLWFPESVSHEKLTENDEIKYCIQTKVNSF